MEFSTELLPCTRPASLFPARISVVVGKKVRVAALEYVTCSFTSRAIIKKYGFNEEGCDYCNDCVLQTVSTDWSYI